MVFGHRFVSYNSDWELTLIIIAFILLIALVISLAAKSRRANTPEYLHNIVALDKRYTSGEIDRDRYDEILSILDDEDSKESAVIIIKERLAAGRISSMEYFKIRENLTRNYKSTNQTELNKYKYAAGEISEDEFLFAAR